MQAKDSLGKRATRRHKRTWIVPLVFFGAAAIYLAGGTYWLWLHVQVRTPESFRAGAGLSLLLLAAVQTRLAWAAWRNRPDVDQLSGFRHRLFWRWIACGFVVCYGVGLLIGTRHGARYFFWPAMAAWFTIVQVALVARPQPLGRVLALLERRRVRAVGWTVYVLVMLPLGAEAALRIYALAMNDPVTVAYVTDQLKLTPGNELRGQRINDLGYWDEPFSASAAPGRFRVAAVGDDITLCGDVRTNFLTQIERLVPHLDVYNFGIPETGPRQYAAQIAREVASYQPDVVLIFFSVDTDVTDEVPLPGAFQWDGLHLVQFGSRFRGGRATGMTVRGFDGGRLTQQSTSLNERTGGLAVCRTPIDVPMRRRWREVLGHLGASVEACRKRDLTPALVVVPSHFQVNPGLCEVMCRRGGYDAAKLDLNLPQRRLAEYAKDIDLPMLDLLPVLRSTGSPTFERNRRLLNDRGNAIAAEAIGAWLMKQYGSRLGEVGLAGG